MTRSTDLGLKPGQLDIACGVIRAVKERGWPQKAAVITLDAGLVESSLQMIASANVPESQRYPHVHWSGSSDGLGHDHASMGFLQQQTGYAWTPANGGRAVSDATMEQSTMSTANGWGKPRELMDPEISTKKFLDELARHDWRHMQNGAAAQAVQGSAFPDRYQQRDPFARRIVSVLWAPRTDDPRWSDVMTKKQLNDAIDTRVRAAVLGTTSKQLHAERPGLYVRPVFSPDGRLKSHNRRLAALEKKVRV
jgi:hypothetical protein